MTPDLRIAVVGAGIGGATAALALARRGFRPEVHERGAAPGEVGAGLQLGPNAMKVLAALGIGDAVTAVAMRPARVRLRDGLSGRDVAAVPLGRAIAARHGAPYCQVHRADLLDILHRALRAANVPLRFGAEVAPGAVDAEVIVAADGVRSAHRARLNPGVAPGFTGQVAWRGLVPGDAVALDPDTHVFMGPGRHMVAYPLRGGRLWNLVAVEERQAWAAEGWRHPGDAARLRDAFAGWCPEVRTALAAVEAPHLWGLFAHDPLACWQDGRTVLLGDACHPMQPFMAQGAAMAIEDAWVLAACLAQDGSVAPALGRYEARRKPRATRVQRQSAANALIYHLRHPVLRRGLHIGMALQDRLLPGALARRFDWLYGGDVTRS